MSRIIFFTLECEWEGKKKVDLIAGDINLIILVILIKFKMLHSSNCIINYTTH